MTEPLIVPDPNTPAPVTPPATDPNKDLTSIMEGLGKLSETVQGLNGRLDEFDERLKETPPDPGEEGLPKWQPKTWDEFPEKAAEVARQTIEQVEKERRDQVRAREEKNQNVQSQIDKEFDTQLQQLEDKGLIPGVKDMKDPGDPGKLVRKELFGLGIKYNSPDLVAMANLRNEWMDQGYAFDVKDSKWIKANPRPFGAGAPVGSSSKTTAPGSKPTYAEIHNLSMDEMIRRYNS